MHDFKIPVYIINLKERIDRQKHIINEFRDKPEFEIFLFEAIRNPIGAVGLWKSIMQIVEMAKDNDDDVIIICEDDHQFTEAYAYEHLLLNIEMGARFGANILLGGITGEFANALKVSKGLYWIDSFWGTQFVILYSHFYDKILNSAFDETVVADGLLSELTSNKFTFYPMISIQKSIGDSDINSDGDNFLRIRNLTESVNQRLEKLDSAYRRLSRFI